MTSLEEIGALLGFLAFAGLAVLVFLTFQQARHLRRLRDWAGRAPERAAALAARGEGQVEREPSEEEMEAVADSGPGRLARFDQAARLRWAEFDRRLPVDGRLLVGGLAAIVLGVGIATGAFGLLGDESGSGEPTKSSKGSGKKGENGDRAAGNAGENKAGKADVAVLNGTAPPGGTGVVGIADRVSQNVQDAGFKVGAVDNAGSFTTSTVMWTGDGEANAQTLADALTTVLGPVAVVEMTADIEALAGGAEVALVIGQDDASI